MMLISDSAASHNRSYGMLLMIVASSMYDLYLVEWALQVDFCRCRWYKHLLVSICGQVPQQVFSKFFCFVLLFEPFIHEHFLLLIIWLEYIFFNQ